MSVYAGRIHRYIRIWVEGCPACSSSSASSFASSPPVDEPYLGVWTSRACMRSIGCCMATTARRPVLLTSIPGRTATIRMVWPLLSTYRAWRTLSRLRLQISTMSWLKPWATRETLGVMLRPGVVVGAAEEVSMPRPREGVDAHREGI